MKIVHNLGAQMQDGRQSGMLFVAFHLKLGTHWANMSLDHKSGHKGKFF